MKKPLLFLFFILTSIQFYAQGEANNWYFGRNAGVTFNTNPPSALSDGQLNTTEGCSAISDTGGNLLFYTDGRTVWDKNHQIMPNANYFGNTGLHGDPSSTQSGLIVPHPTITGIYYIFTVDEPHHQNANAYPNQGPADNNGLPLPNYEEGTQFTIPSEDDGFNNGFNYSIVDMSLRGGLGDVVQGQRNNHLITYDENDSEEIKFQCAEKISAVVGEDCNSIWVITHFINRFYAFLIDEDGVDENPVISQTGPNINLSSYRRNAIGYIKVSPDGEKLLMSNAQTSNSSNTNGNVFLFDFDNATGEVSNAIELASNVSPYGVEFSPDSSKAFASISQNGAPSDIYQWDLAAGNISSSLFSFTTSMNQATALQLGPNGKIYTPEINSARLNVINDPNEYGEDFNYSNIVPLGAISLQGNISTFGLPPFIQSIFTSRVDIISGENQNENEFDIETEISICDGESFILGAEYETSATYQWFENGEAIAGENTSFLEISLPTNEQAPYSTAFTLEIFPDSGECKLSGIANVVFGVNPEVTESTLVQCVTDIESETATFNLTNSENDFLVNEDEIPSNYEFTFFESLEDAENENPIPDATAYQNTSNPQEVYVEITNAETRCSSVATLNLIVADITGTEEVELTECDTNLDGFQSFDLNLTTDLTNLTPTQFYTSINDALQDENRISDVSSFNNTEAYSQIIYFRTDSNEGCGILGVLTLSVNDLPFLFEDKEVFYCIEDSPNQIGISPSVPSSQINNYEYFWPSTNEATFSIQINEAGTYQVLVSEIATGCEALQNIIVTNSSLADFEVILDDGRETSNSISILVDETGSLGAYDYAIQNQGVRFQELPFFTDLAPGFYDVFVRDLNGCGISERTVGVIGAMQFFTPNNDGNNDYWNILGLPSNQNARVNIFDRYGKLLVEFQAQNHPGWNGTYNGKLMANNDYWYLIQLDDGRVLRGNLTLKR